MEKTWHPKKKKKQQTAKITELRSKYSKIRIFQEHDLNTLLRITLMQQFSLETAFAFYINNSIEEEL